MNDASRQTEIPEASIREELGRVLQSPIFAQSERLGRFLRFTVDAVLSGKSDSLKEYVIGTEVYDRQPTYHPSQDSIVRTEARRLRAKLREYYEAEGATDPVLIYFRTGSYAPVFRLRDAWSAETAGTSGPSGDRLFRQGRGVSITVVPFESNSEERASSTCAAAITDELIHGLMRTEGCRVTSAGSAEPIAQHRSDLPALAMKLGVDILFEGSVRQEGQHLRVTARLIAADGFQIWSQRFEMEPEPDQLFEISEQIARSLINRTRPELSSVRKLRTAIGSGILNSYPSVLSAEALVDEGAAADIAAAILKFEELVREYPAFARPLCGLAQSRYELALQGVEVSATAISEAKAQAQKAAALDPEMLQVHGCIAALSVLEWNWSAAAATFLHALKLGPHAATYRQYALLLTVQKRFDEAWSYLQTAQEMDAFSHRQKTARARFLYVSRRYSEIDRHFPRRFVYGQIPVEARLYLALIYLELGRLDEARSIAREIRHFSGVQPTIAASLAEVLTRCGDESLANALVRDHALLSPIPGIGKFRQSLLSMALGDQAGALSFLSAAHENREPEMIWLHVDPRLDGLRGYPGFAALADGLP